jgi:hypothetical protein
MGILYVNGHARVYHGGQTQLPRHHMARQKLCPRAICDYWVNVMDGQPFFAANPAVNPGLTLVFDRESYSPGLMRRMKARRVACLTYHKYTCADWRRRRVPCPAGQTRQRPNRRDATGRARDLFG